VYVTSTTKDPSDHQPASESAVYTTSVFDLAGRVTSVTTPDNAVVTTAYSGNSVTVKDAVGRLNSLSTSATTYAASASVSSIGYASHSALSTETYGNGLIHAIDYNKRLQPTQIKLGTSGNPTSVISLGYTYGTVPYYWTPI
jgi:hypothetical protein